MKKSKEYTYCDLCDKDITDNSKAEHFYSERKICYKPIGDISYKDNTSSLLMRSPINVTINDLCPKCFEVYKKYENIVSNAGTNVIYLCDKKQLKQQIETSKQKDLPENIQEILIRNMEEELR